MQLPKRGHDCKIPIKVDMDRAEVIDSNVDTGMSVHETKPKEDTRTPMEPHDSQEKSSDFSTGFEASSKPDEGLMVSADRASQSEDKIQARPPGLLEEPGAPYPKAPSIDGRSEYSAPIIRYMRTNTMMEPIAGTANHIKEAKHKTDDQRVTNLKARASELQAQARNTENTKVQLNSNEGRQLRDGAGQARAIYSEEKPAGTARQSIRPHAGANKSQLTMRSRHAPVQQSFRKSSAVSSEHQRSWHHDVQSPKKQQPVRQPTVTEILRVLGNTLQVEIDKGSKHSEANLENCHAEVLRLRTQNSQLEFELRAMADASHENEAKNEENKNKIKAYADKTVKLHKFLNGLNNDVQRERTAAKQRDEKIAALKSESCILRDDFGREKERLTAAITSSSDVKAKLMTELQELGDITNKLKSEKAILSEQIDGKNQQLIGLSMERDRLKRQFESLQTSHDHLQKFLTKKLSAMTGGIAGVQTSLEMVEDKFAELSQVALTQEVFQKNHSIALEAVRGLEGIVQTLNARSVSSPSTRIN